MTKVVICGTATTSLHLANTFAPEWKILSCNGAYQHLNRLDMHFELHDIDYLKNEVKPDPTYFDFLLDIRDKAVLNNTNFEFPDARAYPLQEICNFVGANYFNNTIAYIIAYAMWFYPDLTDLALIGVDMSGEGEYVHQRPNCEFYLGMAKGKGIKVHIPEGCPLLNSSHLYGFEKLPAFMVSSRQKLKELKNLEIAAEEKKRLADKDYYYTKGMKELLEIIIKRYQ